jgi:hypothetical protein
VTKLQINRMRTLIGGIAVLMAVSFSTVTVDAKQSRTPKHSQTMSLTAPGGVSKAGGDFHCGAGQLYSCDDPKFASDCAILKGTVSGKQGFGGKTCWVPTSQF